MHKRSRISDSSSARRAIKLNAFVEYVDKRTLHTLHDGTCGICGKPVKFGQMTIDHIQPLSRGGVHSYANTQPAHGICNHVKSNSLDGEFDIVEAIRRVRQKRASKRFYNKTGRERAQLQT